MRKKYGNALRGNPEVRFLNIYVGLYVGLSWKICQNRLKHPKSAKFKINDFK